MAITVANLVAQIGADLTQFKLGMNEVDARLRQVESRARSTSSNIDRMRQMEARERERARAAYARAASIDPRAMDADIAAARSKIEMLAGRAAEAVAKVSRLSATATDQVRNKAVRDVETLTDRVERASRAYDRLLRQQARMGQSKRYWEDTGAQRSENVEYMRRRRGQYSELADAALGVDQARAARIEQNSFEYRVRALNNIAGAAERAGLATAAGLAVAAKSGADYNQTLTTAVHNTSLVGKEAVRFREEIKRIQLQTGQDEAQLAEGFKNVENYGYSLQDTVTVVQNANKAAVAGGADISKFADLTAGTLKNFNINVKDSAKAVNLLWQVAKMSHGDVEAVGKVMGTAFAYAGNMKVGLADVGAAYVTFTRHQIDASRAITQLINDLNKLTSPTEKVRKELEKLDKRDGSNLANTFTRRGLRIRGFDNAIQDVLDVAQKESQRSGKEVTGDDLMAKLFPNLRGTLGATTLGKYFGEFKKAREELLKSTRDTTDIDRAYNEQLREAATNINRVFAAGRQLAADVSGSLAPAIGRIADRVKELKGWWDGLSQAAKDNIVTMTEWGAVGLIAFGGAAKFIVGIASMVRALKELGITADIVKLKLFQAMASARGGFGLGGLLAGAGNNIKSTLMGDVAVGGGLSATTKLLGTAGAAAWFMTAAKGMDGGSESGMRKRTPAELAAYNDDILRKMKAGIAWRKKYGAPIDNSSPFYAKYTEAELADQLKGRQAFHDAYYDKGALSKRFTTELGGIASSLGGAEALDAGTRQRLIARRAALLRDAAKQGISVPDYLAGRPPKDEPWAAGPGGGTPDADPLAFLRDHDKKARVSPMDRAKKQWDDFLAGLRAKVDTPDKETDEVRLRKLAQTNIWLKANKGAEGQAQSLIQRNKAQEDARKATEEYGRALEALNGHIEEGIKLTFEERVERELEAGKLKGLSADKKKELTDRIAKVKAMRDEEEAAKQLKEAQSQIDRYDNKTMTAGEEMLRLMKRSPQLAKRLGPLGVGAMVAKAQAGEDKAEATKEAAKAMERYAQAVDDAAEEVRRLNEEQAELKRQLTSTDSERALDRARRMLTEDRFLTLPAANRQQVLASARAVDEGRARLDWKRRREEAGEGGSGYIDQAYDRIQQFQEEQRSGYKARSREFYGGWMDAGGRDLLATDPEKYAQQIQQVAAAFAILERQRRAAMTADRPTDKLVEDVSVRTEQLHKKMVDLGHGLRYTRSEWESLDKAAQSAARNLARDLDIQDYLRGVAEGIEGIFEKMFHRLRDNGFKGFFKSIVQMFDEMLFEMAVKWAANKLIMMLLGAVGGANAQAQYLEGRASGGTVERGRAYIVGENGPELFTPRSSGYVSSASQTRQAAGGGHVFNFVFTTPEAVAAAQRSGSQWAVSMGRNIQAQLGRA